MSAEFVVAAVGDLMLGDSPTSPGYGFRTAYPRQSAWEALQPLGLLTAGADLVLGNLEVVLSDQGEGMRRIDRDAMRGDRDYAKVLAHLGFNVIAVANNHAMQHGDRGFAQTVDALRSAGLDVAGLRGEDGWCCQPILRTAGSGICSGVLAYSFRPRQYGTGVPPYAAGTEVEVVADVQRLAPLVDHVVISLHWGEEFVNLPSVAEVAFAERLVHAGAKLIIGHHPHVVRPIDFDGRTCIAHSLGNACSDMVFLPEFRAGLALRARMQGVGMHVESRQIDTDADYRVGVPSAWAPVVPGRCTPLPMAEYREAILRSMTRYRRALLPHILRNVPRVPPDILVDLLWRKARNLFARYTSATSGRT
jgi:poly-gamma-glutamate synthesis protein (capsule biosynthesis protein)